MRVLGTEHANTFESLEKMAGCLRSLGRDDEELPHYRKVLEARTRVQGAEHPDTLYSLSGLAACLEALGRAGQRHVERPQAVLVVVDDRRRLDDDDRVELGIQIEI